MRESRRWFWWNTNVQLLECNEQNISVETNFLFYLIWNEKEFSLICCHEKVSALVTCASSCLIRPDCANSNESRVKKENRGSPGWNGMWRLQNGRVCLFTQTVVWSSASQSVRTLFAFSFWAGRFSPLSFRWDVREIVAALKVNLKITNYLLRDGNE